MLDRKPVVFCLRYAILRTFLAEDGIRNMEGFFVDEKIREILDKYAFHVTAASRGRGAFICETDQGLKIVREYTLSPSRLVFESLVKYTVRDRGYMNVDQLVVNQDGELLTKNKYDKGYVVREWYEGRECDMKNRDDLTALVINLARLHKVLRDVPLSPEMAAGYSYGGMRPLLERHCREMKAIRNYMRARKQKKPFESLYLEYYEEFAAQAFAAAKALDAPGYVRLTNRARKEHMVCHGDYSHHNVLLMRGRTAAPALIYNGTKLPPVATVNFDKMQINIQINDLYLFLRKVLEKNRWDGTLANALVDAYEHVLPLSGDERHYLYVLLLFPEKLWKIANHYYNTRKSWTSGKNEEKLEAFIGSRRLRRDFLDSFYEPEAKRCFMTA